MFIRTLTSFQIIILIVVSSITSCQYDFVALLNRIELMVTKLESIPIPDYNASSVERSCEPTINDGDCLQPYGLVSLTPGKKSCMYISIGKHNWTSAKVSCESSGGHLMTFGSRNKSVALANYFALQGPMDPYSDFWIGGQKLYDRWYWKGLFTSLIPGYSHPQSHWSDITHEGDCLLYAYKGLNSSRTGWVSWPWGCESDLNYACEKLSRTGTNQK